MSTNFVYSIPISEPKQGESAIYRHPNVAQGELMNMTPSKSTNLQEGFLNSFTNFADQDCLGTKNKSTGKYQFKKYSTVLGVAKDLGSGIISLQLTTEQKDGGVLINPIGVFAKNREQWTVLDVANALYGFTIVPFYDTLGPESIQYVLQNSQISTCFVSNDGLQTLSLVNDLQNLSTVVSFDNEIDNAAADVLRGKQVNVIFLKDVIENGQKSPASFPQISSDHIFSFSYTSGTTGDPKAAMITHGNMISGASASLNNKYIGIHPGDTHLSYLPLPHMYQRVIQTMILLNGATICYYGGDMLKLGEDLLIVRPTVFCSVPRILNRYYDGMNMMMKMAKPTRQKQYEVAIKEKTENLFKKTQYYHEIWDNILFSEFRAMLGGRVRYIITGAAPIALEVLNFLKVVLSCPIYEGYAQTESSATSFVTNFLDPTSGHVGGPNQANQFQVVDVPQMEYLSTDKSQDGQLTPRGEIWVRGPNIFKGYYKDEERTKESLDGEGWLHSGDIGIILPNGALKVVDRKQNIFKLSQGEYVSPEKLENVYLRTQGVAEIFVYGDSKENYLVAVIVPNEPVFVQIAQSLGVKGTLQELCADPKLNEAILQSLEAHGRNNNLVGFEIIQKIHLEPVSLMFHGCVTNTLKLQRNIAAKKFEKQISSMYAK